MRVAKIGKRQFAFDLLWNDAYGDDASEAARKALGEDASGYYTVVSGEGEVAEVLGCAQGKVKGRVYSYAEALAGLDRDGIYCASVDEQRCWYAVIQQGIVMPGTDRTIGKNEFISLYTQTLRRTFRVPVFCTDETLTGKDVHPFRLEEAVASSKVKPLKVVGAGAAGNNLVGGIVLAAVVVGIAYGGWYTFLRSPNGDIDQAALDAQARELYIAAAKSEMDQVPTDANWVSDAYHRASLTFDSTLAGWVLDGATCEPGACTATYSLPEGQSTYAVTPVLERYGRERVQMLEDGRSFTVNLELDRPDQSMATDFDVLQPRPALSRAADTLGLLNLSFDQVNVDQKPTTEVIGSRLGAPADMPEIIRETVITSHDTQLEPVRLRTLSAYMSRVEFVATKIAFSSGSGALAPAWSVEWVRFHGGEH